MSICSRSPLALTAALVACAAHPPGGGGGGDDDDGPPPDVDAASPGEIDAAPQPTAPELGTGDHGPASVTLVTVLGSTDLATPMDVEVDPMSGALWVINQGDDSWTVLLDGTVKRRFRDDSSHFFRRPSSLAFARNGERALATCQESTNGGDMFMGPVAWTSQMGPFEGGTASHYDMLHESPNCMGIAWQRDHIWWVFNGTNGVIDKVNFHGWHPDTSTGLGGMDHSDGEYFRYASARVMRVAGVHSGMVVHDGWLYVADTGNRRIAKLDAADRTGSLMDSRFDEVPMRSVPGQLENVVAAGTLDRPSGLVVRNGLLYVSDAGTGKLYAFDTAGTVVNWLDTGLGAGHVGGLGFTADGKLLFTDPTGHRLYRIDP